MIESLGPTSLVQVGSNYFLYPVAGSSGPQLRFGGAAVVANQFGAWVPIGAELIPGGYLVVWKNGALDQYVVWTIDGSGNFLSQGAVLSRASPALQSLEPGFNQDLNNSGGITARTVIEALGATTLANIAGAYVLSPTGSALGQQLKYGGALVAAGQFGAWTPLGAEQAGGRFQVAWKFGSANQYLAWTVDSSGNYISQTAVVAGGTWWLQSYEPALQQDLNGDGTIGPVTATIETVGASTLTRVADSYFVNYASSGPQLRYGGTYVAAGQFGAWTPLGAEQVGGRFQVAWKFGSTDQYLAWTVDSAGNYISQTAVVAGGTWWLQSYEPALQQDLNGDGTIGPVTATIETVGASTLTRVADSYFVNYASSGPQLRYGGTYVAMGQFGAWTPIGAEQILGGYEVAWKNGAADQYLVWNADNAGNWLSQSSVMTGGSLTLQALEASFQQDLNSSGSIASKSAIEAAGSVTLSSVAGRYLLDGPGTLSGPLLRYGGAYVTAGQFGSWTPLGAEWTGSGYQVAWKMGSADQYTVWSTDVSGNYVGQTPMMFGSSSGLENYEPGLQQDLNGDGLIGAPTPAFNIDVSYSGDPTYQSYFTAAAQRWQQVLTGDLPGFNVPGYGFVDDLHITASVSYIDGPGRILGQASPEYYRMAGYLPITGFMTFDSADLAGMARNGTLYYVVLHEMGHVLGIGSMWGLDGLRSGYSFTGSHATFAYQLLSGTSATSVPLETGGGSGTAGVHWSEAVFGNELMTGYIAGVPDPLSTVTVGALQDMGYTVNYSAADAYTLPGHVVAAGESASANAAQVAAEMDNVGTVGFDATTSPMPRGDVAGVGGPGAGDVALLTNYLASTFVTPAAEGTGGVAAAPAFDEQLLAKPPA